VDVAFFQSSGMVPSSFVFFFMPGTLPLIPLRHSPRASGVGHFFPVFAGRS